MDQIEAFSDARFAAAKNLLASTAFDFLLLYLRHRRQSHAVTPSGTVISPE